jgi:hypothetical protein
LEFAREGGNSIGAIGNHDGGIDRLAAMAHVRPQEAILHA